MEVMLLNIYKIKWIKKSQKAKIPLNGVMNFKWFTFCSEILQIVFWTDYSCSSLDVMSMTITVNDHLNILVA